MERWASIHLLCTFLKHDYCEWINAAGPHDMDRLKSTLLQEVQRLAHPLDQQPTCAFEDIPLAAASLLTLMQWRTDVDLTDYEQLIGNSNLIARITEFVCDSASHRTRRSSTSRQAMKQAIDLIYCWSLQGGEPWSVFQQSEDHLRSFLEQFWSNFLKEEIPTTPNVMETWSTVFLIHSTRNTLSRTCLASVLQRRNANPDNTEKPYRILLKRLLDSCRDEVR